MSEFDNYEDDREPFDRASYKHPNLTSDWKKIKGWHGPYQPFPEDCAPLQYSTSTLSDGRYLLCNTFDNKKIDLVGNRGFYLILSAIVLFLFSTAIYDSISEQWDIFSGERAYVFTGLLLLLLLLLLAAKNHFKSKKIKRSQKYVVFDRKEQLAYFPAKKGNLFGVKKIDYPPTVVPFKDVEMYSCHNTMPSGGSYFMSYFVTRRMYFEEASSIPEDKRRYLARIEPTLDAQVYSKQQVQWYWTMINHFMDVTKSYPDSVRGLIQTFQEGNVNVFIEPLPAEEKLDVKLFDLEKHEPINPCGKMWQLILSVGKSNITDEQLQDLCKKIANENEYKLGGFM